MCGERDGGRSGVVGFFFLTFVLVAGARGALRRYPSRAEQRVLVAGRRGAVRRGPRVDSDVIVLAQIAGVADGRCPAAAARGTTSMPLLRAPRSHLAVPALSVVDSDEIPDLAIRRRRVRVPWRQTRGRCGVDGDSCRHDARPFNPRPVPQILMERKSACLSITPKTPLPRFLHFLYTFQSRVQAVPRFLREIENEKAFSVWRAELVAN